MRTKTCCFTGHRIIPESRMDAVAVCTESIVRDLVLNEGIRYFGLGGAIGYDTLAANILFRLRTTEFPDIKIILVYPFEGFTSRWTDEQKLAYARMFPLYDKTVCVASAPGKEAYLARDRHLVGCSSQCVCYCTRQTGGTAYTLRCARQQGLKIYNVAEKAGW